MFVIAAPYPGVKEKIVFPNFQFGDSKIAAVDVQIKSAMNGVRQTHIKTTGRNIYNFTFMTTKALSLKFRLFYKEYIHEKWKLVINEDMTDEGDETDTTITGILQDNPVSFQMDSRDNVTINFTFEGQVV